MAIENTFDAAVLLIAGGALTVSATVVTDLEGELVLKGWLQTAWWAWAACLLLACSGHLLSRHMHAKMLDHAWDGDLASAQALYSSRLGKSISGLNYVTFAAMILGFVGFGLFVFGNLNFGGGQGEQSGQTVNSSRPNDVTPKPAADGAKPPPAGPASPPQADRGGGQPAASAGGAGSAPTSADEAKQRVGEGAPNGQTQEAGKAKSVQASQEKGVKEK